MLLGGVVGRCCREVLLGGALGLWEGVVGKCCWEVL